MFETEQCMHHRCCRLRDFQQLGFHWSEWLLGVFCKCQQLYFFPKSHCVNTFQQQLCFHGLILPLTILRQMQGIRVPLCQSAQLCQMRMKFIHVLALIQYLQWSSTIDSIVPLGRCSTLQAHPPSAGRSNDLGGRPIATGRMKGQQSFAVGDRQHECLYRNSIRCPVAHITEKAFMRLLTIRSACCSRASRLTIPII